jgi:hypothetical protein
MERRVTVNDGIERLELETPEGLEPLEPDDGGEPAAGEGSYGPCLHFGARGERCARPAVADGYCSKHHPDPGLRTPGRSYTRVLVATVALVMILWPYITELVRDLVRWLSGQ